MIVHRVIIRESRVDGQVGELQQVIDQDHGRDIRFSWRVRGKGCATVHEASESYETKEGASIALFEFLGVRAVA